MFQFIKKIKLAFAEKQELLNQIEYLKKRNEFLDNIAKDMEKILSDEACKSLKKAYAFIVDCFICNFKNLLKKFILKSKKT